MDNENDWALLLTLFLERHNITIFMEMYVQRIKKLFRKIRDSQSVLCRKDILEIGVITKC